MSKSKILIRSNTRLTLRKLRPMAIMVALAIALLLMADSVVAAGIAKYSQSITNDSALNVVQVSSLTQNAKRQITNASIEEFRALPGVAAAYGWTQVDLTLDDPANWPNPKNNPGAFWGTPYIPGIAPKLVAGTVAVAGPTSQEIILPSSVADGDLTHLLGQTITFGHTKRTAPGHGELATLPLTVVGLYDNSVAGADGLNPAYVNPDLLTWLLSSVVAGAADISQSNQLPFHRAFITPTEPDDVPSIQNAVAGMGYGVNSVANQIDSLPGLFKLLSLITWGVGIILVLFCIGTGGSIGGSWIQQRTREVGILKSIGWTRSEITRSLCAELAVVGGVVGLAGVILGVLGSLAGTAIFSGLNLALLQVAPWTFPNWFWMVATIVVVPAGLCLGALRSAFKLAKIDADSALRDL